jgi:hypothetical protein
MKSLLLAALIATSAPESCGTNTPPPQFPAQQIGVVQSVTCTGTTTSFNAPPTGSMVFPFGCSIYCDDQPGVPQSTFNGPITRIWAQGNSELTLDDRCSIATAIRVVFRTGPGADVVSLGAGAQSMSTNGTNRITFTGTNGTSGYVDVTYYP